MTARKADRTLLQPQRGEALPKPGQMRRLQMGVECRPAVIHLVKEDVEKRLFHLDYVQLSAARLVGNRMAAIVLRQGQEGVNKSGLTTNSGITTKAAGFPGRDMVSVLPCSRRLGGRRGSGPFHLASQIDHVEVSVQFDVIDGHHGIFRHGSLELDVVGQTDR